MVLSSEKKLALTWDNQSSSGGFLLEEMYNSKYYNKTKKSKKKFSRGRPWLNQGDW